MKISTVLFLLLLSSSIVAQPVKIIFDADMESDVDDVGALAMLHSFADKGEVKILATISSSLYPWSAPTIDAINTYYGRPDIPIGNVKIKGVYRGSVYAKMISEKFPNDIESGYRAPDAVEIYRKILSEQPDSSVVIVSVGYLTNLSYLLDSSPDKYSPLNGKELVKKKVKLYICMGGRFPLQQNPEKWGNFKPDPEAAMHVANAWPTQIIFTTGGEFSNMFHTGKILFTDKAEKGNLIAAAYRVFLKGWNRNYHHSSDLIAVYVAVRGHKPYFKLRKQGYFHIFEDGTQMWRISPDRPNHHIVTEIADGVDPEDVAADFDKFLIK